MTKLETLGALVSFKGEKGRIRFLGKTNFADGDWYGVELFNKVGKNDGSLQGIRYFQCAEGHGIFTKLASIQFEEDTEEQDNSF